MKLALLFLLPLLSVPDSPPLPARQGKGRAPKAKQAPVPLGTYMVKTRLLRKPPKEGEVEGPPDIPETLRLLRQMHARGLIFEVRNRSTDWDDFRALLAATKKTRLRIWIALLSPTLGGNSLPYLGNYEKWAEACVALKRDYDQFEAFLIREVAYGRNAKYLHPGRLGLLKKKLKAGGLAFLGEFYDLTKIAVELYGPCFDGVLIRYMNPRGYRNLQGLLDGARALAPRRWSIHLAIPCAPDPRLSELVEAPVPEVLFLQMQSARKHADGFVLWDLDLRRPSKIHPGAGGYSKLLITAGSYLRDLDAGRPPRLPK